MCSITKHLYVTKAQKANAVPGPRDILPSFLPRLTQCSGWARLPKFNSKHARVFQIPGVKQRSVDCGSCLQRSKSQHHRHLLSCHGPERLQGGLSANTRAQAPDHTLACSGERYQPPGSGLRVGVGVLLAFSSLAEMYSLTITMPADQRQSEVLSCCWLRCDCARFWWADPKVSWGGKEFSSDDCLGTGSRTMAF